MNLVNCKNCVMDGSAKEITLDIDGVCNFCLQAQKSLKEVEIDEPKLPSFIKRIKKDGQGKKYDCLIGLSGGADSSTVLHHAVRLGLRPLCFSVDNGWNDTEKADGNIMKLVETLKVPFYRYTIDLPKFKQLQASFMQAGQINIEVPTDHILMAASLEMANKYGIKWIISGGNVATESIMPESWGKSARDLPYIKSVYKWATGKEIVGLPLCGLMKWNYYKWIKGVKTFYLLDYLGYNWKQSKEMLTSKYGWVNYGEKHEESVFTKWFQNFYLYEKFSIDKRKAHYSSLINAGQMTRDEAIEKLAYEPVYPELGIERRVMNYPKRQLEEFESDERLFLAISKVVRKIRLWKSSMTSLLP